MQKSRSSRPWTRWLKLVFHLLVLTLVIWGIRHTIQKSLAEFRRQEFAWSEVHYAWLLGTGLCYLLGTLPAWWLWHRVLWAMGQQPRAWTSFRAYTIGHLGKYVPGKAMVVVLRAALVMGPQVDKAIAAAAVFVETLTVIAVSAMLAGILLIWHSLSGTAAHQIELPGGRHPHFLLFLASGLVVCTGIPSLPPVFRRVILLLRVDRASPQIAPALQQLKLPLMASGWITNAAGCFLYGLSLWCTLRALPAGMITSSTDSLAQIQQVAETSRAVAADTLSWQALPQILPMITAGLVLAVVAGFVSLIPGGAGVREMVMIAVLAPQFGELAAVLSALLLRLVWLLTELFICPILYAIRPRTPPLDAGPAPEPAS